MKLSIYSLRRKIWRLQRMHYQDLLGFNPITGQRNGRYVTDCFHFLTPVDNMLARLERIVNWFTPTGETFECNGYTYRKSDNQSPSSCKVRKAILSTVDRLLKYRQRG